MEINILGIDLAKHVFQLHGADCRGQVMHRSKVSCSALMETFVSFTHESSLWKPVAPHIIGLGSSKH